MRCSNAYILGFFLLLAGCDSSAFSGATLQDEIAASTLPFSGQLIACAGGGIEGADAQSQTPISIYYYPVSGAKNFRYYETHATGLDPDDFSNYKEVELKDEPFFNGYLRRFIQEPLSSERWARVVFETADSLHVSNAIRLKYAVLPTAYDSAKVVVQPNGVKPTFTWYDHSNALDVIFFQVVSDRNGDLLSGTYTFDKTFTFYELDNVVLNIRDVSPAPVLELEETYKFTLMTVSSDNWVNLIAERYFTTQATAQAITPSE